MLKITTSSEKLAPRLFKAGNNESVRDANGRADKTVMDSSKSKNE